MSTLSAGNFILIWSALKAIDEAAFSLRFKLKYMWQAHSEVDLSQLAVAPREANANGSNMLLTERHRLLFTEHLC